MNRHVLATAFACQPGVGSEPGIGWRWALEIAKRNRLTLITRESNVVEIERAAEQAQVPMKVMGFDVPKRARSLKKNGKGALPYFAHWQKGVADVAREVHAQDPVDVLHHLTYASSWTGSGLSELELPFVWGPVGQHARIPDDAILPSDYAFRAKEVVKTRARRNGAKSKLLMATLDAADVILSLGHEFEERLPLEYQYKTVHMLAAGVDSVDLSQVRFDRNRTLEILFAGKLNDLKGIRLALEAFGKLRYRQPRTRLTILGDGERRPWVQSRVRELGLGDAVRLLGHVSHKKTLEHMAKADLFLLPSFEGGSMVALEAMACGLPVVCLDQGGPGEIVTHNNGVAIPYKGFEATQETLALGLELLIKDEDLRQHVARNGAQWVAHTATWDGKGEKLELIYDQAIEHHQRVQIHRGQMDAPMEAGLAPQAEAMAQGELDGVPAPLPVDAHPVRANQDALASGQPDGYADTPNPSPGQES